MRPNPVGSSLCSVPSKHAGWLAEKSVKSFSTEDCWISGESPVTINTISLFGFIIVLGIVVDDAIVVGEHADFRFRRLGEAPIVAAETAVHRMAAPVISSTVTTIIAFLGLTAISGRFGDMIADIPFTVTVVLLASLVECFLILPNHMSHALEKAGRGRWYDAPSRVVNRGLGWVRDAR